MSRTPYSINLRVFFGGIGVLLFLILTGSFGYTAPASTSKDLDKATKSKIQEAYGKLPLYFIKNDGQVDGKVKFYEKGSGHATFFTKEGVFLLLTRGQKTPKSFATGQERIRLSAEAIRRGGNPKAEPVIASDQRERGNLKSEITRISQLATRNSQLIKLIPLGANKDPEIIAEGQQAGKVNYFTGNDSEKWQTDIPTYRAVVYKEIYPGIDMKFYGNNRELEYDIIVSPGADPSTVRLSYEGIEGLRVTDEGELEIGLKACPEQGRGRGKIFQRKPYIYQVIDGKRVEVEGKFVIRDRESSLVEDSKNTDTDNGHGQRSYGFEVASYDKDHPIIIDPVLVYSTYLGGSGGDSGSGIAVDSSGNVYLTGSTSSTDFPTQNPLQPNRAGWRDAFVTKINPAGDTLVYSTYLGGSYDDSGNGIAVDGAGNVYLAGSTSSLDFPTQNPIQPDFGGGSWYWWQDAFVTMINPAGNALVYSTYLGGSANDGGSDIAVDGAGNAYLTGWTWSTDFPTQNPLQPNHAGGTNDVFVTKISPAGNARVYSRYLDPEFAVCCIRDGPTLVYSTYLGGSGSDGGNGIAVDSSGNVYLTGYTESTDFPTQNPLLPNSGGLWDAFVTKINQAGEALVYSTYLGGSGSDGGTDIAVDSSGNVYLTGSTKSPDFPTQNPIQPDFGGGDDAFVTMINPAGDALVYSTYLGGSYDDYGYGIAVDGSGNAYLTGITESTDFPTQNPLQPDFGGGDYYGGDAFVTMINPAGEALVYSTYLGGSDNDYGNGIAVDGSGNAYLTGYTVSTDFPTQNPLQPDNAGFSDAFLTKIGVGPPFPDIKANSSDDPLFIAIDDAVEITVLLYPGNMSGEISDWWIGALTPYGNYWLDPAQSWVQSDSPVSVGQYPLSDLPARSLLTRTLPPGYYIFFFILDDNSDGILEMTWHDYVVVGVFPWASGSQAEELPDFDSIFQEKIRELTAQ